MRRWLERLADAIDRRNETFGRLISWLMLLLVLVTLSVALLRYGFNLGWVWMQDAYLWINGASFMLAAGYTLLHDGHVRVDFVYSARGRRYRAFVDLFGSLLFLLPTAIAIFWLSFPYVSRSWSRWEGSVEAGGLHGVFLIKTVLLLFCIPLAAQGVSLVIRSLLSLTGGPAGRTGGSVDSKSEFHA